VTVQQNVRLYLGSLQAGEALTHRLDDDRYAWVQVIRGGVTLSDTPLNAGDGTTVSKETKLSIRATDAAEFMLFDLA
jgi:redox-sensitive bicupin YhaK (pirin superfamily)